MKSVYKNIKKVDDTSLSIRRRKYGRGYQYIDVDNNVIKDKRLLGRIKKLVIPPMWSEVNICKWDDGHIQATGRDAKNRKQYIYHSIWEKKRQEKKFAKMKKFGQGLPKLRKEVLENVAQKEWSKSKIIALAILVLDETGIRIGNKKYAERNGTYGLTTLRRKHMNIEDGKIMFEYKGKSNKVRHVEIDNTDLGKLIKKTAELPGYEIFRYKDSEGNFQSVDSEDINEYIGNSIGDKFSSKDFRTWAATRLAVELYPATLEVLDEHPRSKLSSILIRMVADELGNTPTVCKSYYVHPKIMQSIEKGSLPGKIIEKPNPNSWELSNAELEVLKHI